MLRKNNSSIWSWISIVLILTVILFLGVADIRSYIVNYVSNQDKYLHVFTFFALVFITRALFPNFSILKIAIAVLAFSLVLEILQEFISNGLRHFHLSDMLANLLGVALATLIVWLADRKR